jgi:hypothetical protein
MKLGRNQRKWLAKKAKRGFHGYPIGTLAFYGPDNRRASKAVAGILSHEDAEVDPLRRWFSDSGDVREDHTVLEEIAAFLRDHGVQTVVMKEGIFGCPHEEGIDYPEGEVCPQCPYWATHDRFA